MLSEAAQARFFEIMEKFGSTLYENPERCNNLLSDTLRDPKGREWKLERNLLVAALRIDVVQAFSDNGSRLPFEAKVAQLVLRMQEDFGHTEDLAKWSVLTWAQALGIRANEARRSTAKRFPVEEEWGSANAGNYRRAGSTGWPFRIEQRGANITSEEGCFNLVNAPFAITYEGAAVNVALIAMATPILIDTLRDIGQPFIWGRAGDGIIRDDQEVSLSLTDPEEVRIGSDPAGRAPIAWMIGRGEAVDFLEQLVANEPSLQIAIGGPRTHFRARQLKIETIAGTDISKFNGGVLYCIILELIQGYSPKRPQASSWDWFYKMQWTPFRISIIAESIEHKFPRVRESGKSDALNCPRCRYHVWRRRDQSGRLVCVRCDHRWLD